VWFVGGWGRWRLVGLIGYIHAHTHTHARTRTRTHAHTHAYTHALGGWWRWWMCSDRIVRERERE
jgi:hypothetical protein